MMLLVDQERDKYEQMWTSVPPYRNTSPGLRHVDNFMEICKPRQGDLLLDIGCGSGLAGLEFARRGLNVQWLDITDAGLDPAVPRNCFRCQTVWGNWWFRPNMDWGYCSDVMEHLPTEYTMLALERILNNCCTTWFHIATWIDNFGVWVGGELHMTVRSFDWWLERLRYTGNVIEARDLIRSAVFVVERKSSHA